MNKRRLALGLIVAFAVLPPVWMGSRAPRNLDPVLQVDPMTVPQRGENAPAALQVIGLWQLTSPNSLFGGYSALLVLNGSLRAFSDKGAMLTFAEPPTTPNAARFAPVFPDPALDTWLLDIESVTRDPQSRDYWLGYEDVHAIRRFDIASTAEGTVLPPQMRHWPVNAGAEAMVRLPDGRFLILPENDDSALLFAGDPVEDTAAIRFGFTLPEGWYPVDLANLPDGRVLILTRALNWSLPMFSSRLLIADPRQIREGEELQWEQLAVLDDLLPHENYEAMAVVPVIDDPVIDDPLSDNSVIIWIMSDDNRSILQRTLLARLHWRPAAIVAPDPAKDTKKRAKP